MKLNIAILAGDGIGPEIMKQGIAVLDAVAEKFGHEFNYNEAICGADAIDRVGDPFPEETFRICKEADAVLFAEIGALCKYTSYTDFQMFASYVSFERRNCQRC